MQRIIFLWFLFGVVMTARGQADLYVSVNGNDNNPGDKARPFKTIERALAFVRGRTGSGREATGTEANVGSGGVAAGRRVRIRLRGGTYYLSKAIEIEGLPATGIEIGPYADEKVIISAGQRLSLQWTPYRDGIYQAKVPVDVSFERLYVNGQLQVLARYPNYDPSARVFHGTAADAIAPERVRRWKNPVGGYVHALHAGEWGGFHYRIKGVDENGGLQLEGGWQNNRPAAMHEEFRFVENIFEELDAPGEWWLDKTAQILYYYPPAGVSLSNAVIEASHLRNSIELHGTAERPVRHVVLKGLHFEHNERSFMETKEPLLRSDWTIYRGGALLLEGTEDCRIEDCTFTGLGGNAIMVSRYNQRDTIRGCLVADIGANAVCFVGDPGAVRSPAFRYEQTIPYSQLDTVPGPLTNAYPQGCVVTDNLFHHLGEIEKQATGVEIEMASSITVTHNSIYNTPRAGINIGDGCWGGHELAYNDVFNTVLETGDHGAFNSWGRDRYWSSDRAYMDSLVRVHPSLILLDARKQNLIHDNRFRCDHGWDIDLDDGSTHYHIYNNVCLNGGLKLREGFFRIVENNVIVNNSFHPHVWFANSSDVFAHNIVMKKYAPIEIADWGKGVNHNLFPDTMALRAAQADGTDGQSLAGDPGFIDGGKGDYTVAAGSPALGIGFRNFAMNGFGVQKASLRKIALQPAIPTLVTDKSLTDASAILDFLGGRIKSVDGLGDRSAYGLPDESGVIVLVMGENSLLARSGLKDRDVIRVADDKPVKNIKDLLDVYQASGWKGKINIRVIRDQKEEGLVLMCK
jgi:hypothetical protein